MDIEYERPTRDDRNVATAPPPPAPGGAVSGRALAAADVPLAVRKVDRALAKLKDFRGVIFLRLGPIVRFEPFDRVTEDALRVHFHLAPFGSGLLAPLRAVKLEDVDHLIAHYERIKTVLQRHATAFVDGTPKDKNNRLVVAAAPLNGGQVIFSKLYRKVNGADGQAIGPHSRAAVLIHEGMHAVDAAKVSARDDIHISEFQPAYSSQSAEQALFNPSSFASFAAHVVLGSDPAPRFGLGAGRFR